MTRQEQIIKNLKALRKRRGLTQRQVADRTGIKHYKYANIELGYEEAEPFIERLAKLFNVTPKEITAFDYEKIPTRIVYEGLTPIQYFAGCALTGLLANGCDEARAIKESFALAAEMLREQP
jgi:transcriptional regulator with XRE-family HTH domain